MKLPRRSLLRGGAVVTGTGIAGCSGVLWCDDIACFNFEHVGYDDALDALTIEHTGGRDLPADEVFVTGIAEDWPPYPEDGTTRPWFELDFYTSRHDGIADTTVEVDIAFVRTVQVLWRTDEDEQVIGEWNY